MLKHPLTPQWFKLFKKTAAVLFVAEGLAFAGTYFAWYRLNTNRGELTKFLENFCKHAITFGKLDRIVII